MELGLTGKAKLKVFRQLKRGSYVSFIRKYIDLNYKVLDRNGYTVFMDGRIEKNGVSVATRCDKDGYRKVDLWLKVENKFSSKSIKLTVFIHQLVALKYCLNSNYKKQWVVNHIDGNRENNKAKNLEWCSVKQNMLHSRVSNIKFSKRNTNLSCKELMEIKEENSIRKLSRKFNLNDFDVMVIKSVYTGSNL